MVAVYFNSDTESGYQLMINQYLFNSLGIIIMSTIYYDI